MHVYISCLLFTLYPSNIQVIFGREPTCDSTHSWRLYYSAVPLGTQAANSMTWAAFRVHLRVNSESTPWRLLAQFTFRVWRSLQRLSNGSSKMADGSDSGNCSFNCKGQLTMEAAILKNPFSQWVVLLIANGGPPYGGCHFLDRTAFRVGRLTKFPVLTSHCIAQSY